MDTVAAATAADTAVWIGAIAEGAKVLVLAMAVVYAGYQSREARRTRQLTTILGGYERLHGRAARDGRRELYQTASKKSPHISNDDQQLIESVIADFQFLGQLVEMGLVDSDVVADLYYSTVIRCWQACKPFIDDERNRRNSTRYAYYFEYLYDRCVDFQRRKYPTDAFVFYRESASTN